ncbi:unnamed protein product, partial [Rotaria sordida]
MIIHDIVRTQFNQTGDRLRLFNTNGKSIKIIPYGIYQLDHNDRNLTQFNKLEIQRRYENQS